MVTKRGFAFLACLLSVFLIGCSDAPSGFPKVAPCKIVVTNGATPIDGVEITLQPETPASGMVFFGKTDASGECQVGTTFANHHEKGVPEGSYKVILAKEPFVEDTKSEEEQYHMSQGELEAYRKSMQTKRDALPRIIPTPMTKASTTTLKVDVSGKETVLNVDVSSSL